MRPRVVSVMSISVLAWSAVLLMPSPAKAKTAAERAEKPSLDVEEKTQEATDRADRATDNAVRMLDRVIIKSRAKSAEAKTAVNDSLLTAMTKLALVSDERVKGRQMAIETKNGIVTLSGTVDSDAAKTAAEIITKSVEGIRGVKVNLQVIAPSEPSIEEQDDAITDKVNTALKKGPKLKKTEIAVQTDKGIVTLTGAVPDLVTSAQAAWTAWQVKGVRAVNNELAVKNK